MKKKTVLPDFPRPLIFAHRGFSSLAPENTCAAFRLLPEYGIPGVELDVQLCASGELVVYHDFTLKRLTRRDIKIADTAYSRLREIDAGSWKGPAFAGERIPLLREVFELLGTAVYYDIEIKQEEKKTAGLEEKLLSLITEFRLEKHCIVSSFNPFPLRLWRRLAAEIPAAVIFSKSAEVPAVLRRGEGRFISRPEVLKPHFSFITPAYLEKFGRHRGYTILTWTVNEQTHAEKLLRLGIDGIISDDPVMIIKCLGGR